MEHTCYKCNAVVPEGNAFCGHCGAPQIRVLSASERQAQDLPPLPTDATAAHPEFSAEAVAEPRARVVWSAATLKAAIAGFVMVLAMGVAVGLVQSVVMMMATMFLGGMFAVWLYQRGSTAGPVTTRVGSLVGATTGFFGFIVFSIIFAAQFSATGSGAIRSGMEEFIKRNPDPNARQVLEPLMTPAGIATLITASAVMLLIMLIVLCAAGGATAGRMLQRRRP